MYVYVEYSTEKNPFLRPGRGKLHLPAPVDDTRRCMTPHAAHAHAFFAHFGADGVVVERLFKLVEDVAEVLDLVVGLVREALVDLVATGTTHLHVVGLA